MCIVENKIKILLGWVFQQFIEKQENKENKLQQGKQQQQRKEKPEREKKGKTQLKRIDR